MAALLIPIELETLFQRSIPGFTPSPESYAPALRAPGLTRDRLARNGVRDPRHVELWTALMTGLVDQQISNDAGGDRWTRLIADAAHRFVSYCSDE